MRADRLSRTAAAAAVDGAAPPPRAGRLAQTFASLGEHNFRVFWVGQAVSQVGSWMQAVAQAILVLRLTGSPAALGLVTALQFLPFTLLSLVGGVIADRLPKRRTLVVVQSVATVQAVMMTALAWSGAVEAWHVYLLAMVLGTANAVERPVRQAFFSELVPLERLPNAVALNSSQVSLTRVFGPAFGGVVIAAAGVEGAFAINAVSFLAVLGGYALMRRERFYPARRAAAGEGLWRQIQEGLSYSWHTPSARFLFILAAFIGLFGYNYTVLVPLVATRLLGGGAGQLGLLQSSIGIGSLVAAFILAGAAPPSRHSMLLSAGVFAAVLLCVSVSRLFVVTFAALALMGAFGVATMTSANSALQTMTPAHLRGRVLSLLILLQTGTSPLGGFTLGFLAEHLGVGQAVAIYAGGCGVGAALAAVYAARLRARREG